MTILNDAKNFLDQEIQGLHEVQDQLDQSFVDAVELIFQTQGKVIVTGMGKSGHIGNKIAATLSSTGTPALFLHPAEGVHGDLGVITDSDVVLAITKSGHTEELLGILPTIRRIGCPVIAMTGNPESELAQRSEIHLSFAVSSEACPMNLAPTTSTTAALALGDALALCLLNKRQFTPEKFALFHPQGSLGKKLLTTVEDLMLTGNRIAKVPANTPVQQSTMELMQKGLGLLAVVDENDVLQGVFSVGDLGRLMQNHEDLDWNQPISNLMITTPQLVQPQDLAAKALKIMEDRSIVTLVVVDAKQHVVGLVQLYDLLRAGLA